MTPNHIPKHEQLGTEWWGYSPEQVEKALDRVEHGPEAIEPDSPVGRFYASLENHYEIIRMRYEHGRRFSGRPSRKMKLRLSEAHTNLDAFKGFHERFLAWHTGHNRPPYEAAGLATLDLLQARPGQALLISELAVRYTKQAELGFSFGFDSES